MSRIQIVFLPQKISAWTSLWTRHTSANCPPRLSIDKPFTFWDYTRVKFGCFYFNSSPHPSLLSRQAHVNTVSTAGMKSEFSSSYSVLCLQNIAFHWVCACCNVRSLSSDVRWISISSCDSRIALWLLIRLLFQLTQYKNCNEIPGELVEVGYDWCL